MASPATPAATAPATDALGAPLTYERGGLANDKFTKTTSEYEALHNSTVEDRLNNCAELSNQYYDLATDFYEYGWGQSFHFWAPTEGESDSAALVRHEHYLALRLGLRAGMKALDVGCGVGGPLSNIARFSGAHVVGLNNNAYQLTRATKSVTRQKLADRVSFLKADFMNMPVPDNTFDGAYAIEATCHAVDMVGCYAEVLRVLKPGAMFATYEWVLTDKWVADDPLHRQIKKEIEIGNGVADLRTAAVVTEAARKAGFEIIEARDINVGAARPWYTPLNAGFTLSGFRHTTVGIFFTHAFLWLAELVGLAPAGSIKMHNMLRLGAHGLVEGGKTGTFTPMWFILCRKPLSADASAAAAIEAK